MKLHLKGKKCIWWQVKIRWRGEERVRVQVLIKQKKTCACFVCTMPCIASDQTTGVHLSLSTEPVLQHHSGSRKALGAGTEDLAVGLEEGLQLPGRGVGQLVPSPSPSPPLGQSNLTCGGLFSDPAQPQTAVSTKRMGGGAPQVCRFWDGAIRNGQHMVHSNSSQSRQKSRQQKSIMQLDLHRNARSADPKILAAKPPNLIFGKFYATDHLQK